MAAINPYASSSNLGFGAPNQAGAKPIQYNSSGYVNDPINGPQLNSSAQVSTPANYGQPVAQPGQQPSAQPTAAQPTAQPQNQYQPYQPNAAATQGVTNPYLSGQANSIAQQANQNLQYNILPQLNSGAMAAGGFGGSRQGIAQGLAIGQTQQGITNALASLYGNAYTADQANQTQRYGIDTNAATSRYGADSSAAASRYGADSSLKGSMYGADTSKNIATMNNATTQRGQDQTYSLGQAQNDINRQNANTNATNVSNQYQLGLGQNEIGRQNANTSATNVSNNYNLGLGQNQNQATANANNYDLGLRSNDLGYSKLDSDIYQNNFNNQLNGANFGMDVYNTLMNGNNLGLTAGNNMQNTPIDYFNTFNNNANAIGNGFGTTTQGTTSNPLMGAIGGAQIGSQLYNAFSTPRASTSFPYYNNDVTIPMQAGGGY